MRNHFLFHVLIICLPFLAQAQEMQKILPPEYTGNGMWGSRIATSGDYLITGWVANESAYIYHYLDGQWVLDAKLFATDGPDTSRGFGFSVAIFESYAVVGAPYDDEKGISAGAVCIYKRTNTGWLLQKKLFAPDAGEHNNFGLSVAISEKYLVVGSPGADDPHGAGYVFNRDGEEFDYKFKLTPGPLSLVSGLGFWDVSLAGSYVVQRARQPYDKLLAMIYFIDSAEWQLEAVFDFRGDADLSGEYFVFGDILDDEMGYLAGAVYVYHKIGSTWVQEAKLFASDGQANDRFGSSITILGDNMVVGASNSKSDVGQGAAYVFKQVGADWVELVKLTDPEGKYGDRFGWEVAISQNFYVAGAPYRDDLFPNCGALYTFKRENLVDVLFGIENASNCSPATDADYLPDFLFKFSNKNGASVKSSRNNGLAGTLMPKNDTSYVEIVSLNPWWDVCVYEKQVVTDSMDTLQLTYTAEPEVECPYMSIDITSPLLRRCFTSNIYVHYCNNGTLAANNATIRVVLDANMEFVSATAPISFQSEDTLFFELGTVGVADCGDISIKVDISCEAELGQLHCYSAHVYPDSACNVIVGRTVEFEVEECRQNVGSFDPNDKTGFPFSADAVQSILPGKELKYQIRFQNTGTDTAFNVIIIDTLSPNLDLASFRLGATSHPVQSEISGRTLRFWFKNILLPDDKVNEPASHGFINYFISQKKDLAIGQIIENRAAIYFDFNEPIITNTVVHQVRLPDRSKPTLDFLVYPNPSVGKGKGSLQLAKPGSGRCLIYDLRGRLVGEAFFETRIFDLSSIQLVGGVYLVRVILDSGEWGVKTWVVQP